MKVWAILIALALGMSLIPSCKEKSQVSSRVIVTAVNDIDEIFKIFNK